MAPTLLPSALLVLACVPWCALTADASENSEDTQAVTRTLNQLRSILAFLPRPQKCDKFLFDLMKECVDEGKTPPMPATTRVPTPPKPAEEVTRKPLPAVAAPADDEDASAQGSGFGPLLSRPMTRSFLPEEASRYRPAPYAFPSSSKLKARPARKDGRKLNRNKNKKQKKMKKMKRIGSKRTAKLKGKENTRTIAAPKPATKVVKKDDPRPPPPAPQPGVVKAGQQTWDTSMRAHSPEFFKYMGMG